MIKTVNVIEYENDAISKVTAFEESDTGNQQAELLFREIVKMKSGVVTEEELNVFLDDGWYEQGDFQLFIIHSE